MKKKEGAGKRGTVLSTVEDRALGGGIKGSGVKKEAFAEVKLGVGAAAGWQGERRGGRSD